MLAVPYAIAQPVHAVCAFPGTDWWPVSATLALLASTPVAEAQTAFLVSFEINPIRCLFVFSCERISTPGLTTYLRTNFRLIAFELRILRFYHWLVHLLWFWIRACFRIMSSLLHKHVQFGRIKSMPAMFDCDFLGFRVAEDIFKVLLDATDVLPRLGLALTATLGLVMPVCAPLAELLRIRQGPRALVCRVCERLVTL